MKLCVVCYRANYNTIDECIKCGGDKFQDLSEFPDWDSIEPYLENNDDIN